jgi:hypothetical protein
MPVAVKNLSVSRIAGLIRSAGHALGAEAEDHLVGPLVA